MNCKHCMARVFEGDRCCPQCGAPILEDRKKKQETERSHSTLLLAQYNLEDIKRMIRAISDYNGGKTPSLFATKGSALAFFPFIKDMSNYPIEGIHECTLFFKDDVFPFENKPVLTVAVVSEDGELGKVTGEVFL